MGREDRNGVRASGPFSCPTRPTPHVSESWLSCLESGGREGIRTPGLLVANEALSQLSYSPTSSNKILAKGRMVANLAFVGHRLFAGTFTACPQNDYSISGLIRGNSRALRHDLTRILV